MGPNGENRSSRGESPSAAWATASASYFLSDRVFRSGPSRSPAAVMAPSARLPSTPPPAACRLHPGHSNGTEPGLIRPDHGFAGKRWPGADIAGLSRPVIVVAIDEDRELLRQRSLERAAFIIEQPRRALRARARRPVDLERDVALADSQDKIIRRDALAGNGGLRQLGHRKQGL